MARLNKTDSALVGSLVGKPAWEALLKLVVMTINDLNSRKASGQDAFETLRSLHIKEGKVGGLQEFFDGIEKGESLTDISELR